MHNSLNIDEFKPGSFFEGEVVDIQDGHGIRIRKINYESGTKPKFD